MIKIQNNLSLTLNLTQAEKMRQGRGHRINYECYAQIIQVLSSSKQSAVNPSSV